MNAKLVAIVLVAMIAMTAGQYDIYKRGGLNRWSSRGLGSLDRWSLGSRGLGRGNSWDLGLGGGSFGHRRYRRAALGYRSYNNYDNVFHGNRWENRLRSHLGGSFRRSGLRGSLIGY